jgi:hypothetical protein
VDGQHAIGIGGLDFGGVHGFRKAEAAAIFAIAPFDPMEVAAAFLFFLLTFALDREQTVGDGHFQLILRHVR